MKKSDPSLNSSTKRTYEQLADEVEFWHRQFDMLEDILKAKEQNLSLDMAAHKAMGDSKIWEERALEDELKRVKGVARCESLGIAIPTLLAAESLRSARAALLRLEDTISYLEQLVERVSGQQTERKQTLTSPMSELLSVVGKRPLTTSEAVSLSQVTGGAYFADGSYPTPDSTKPKS